MSSTAARTTTARRTAVIAVTMLTVGAAAVIAPTSAIVAANAAGIAPAAVSASSLAGAVTASGAAAVVATSGTTAPAPTRVTSASRSTARTAIAPARVGTKAYSKWYARTSMAKRYGWKSQRQYQCLVSLWRHESGWRHKAHNSRSGAHGIPQALPGSKMASAGPNWRTNPRTQIKWGLKYIKGRYGAPCGALSHWQRRGWY